VLDIQEQEYSEAVKHKINTTRNKMKYQIISYDDVWHIATVKAAEDDAGLENGMIIPVSLVNISGVTDFERRVYQAYMGSRPPSIDLVNSDVMAHVTSNVSTTLPLPDTFPSTRPETEEDVLSNPWSIHSDSTITQTRTVIPDEVI
jgi:hypothetical protein